MKLRSALLAAVVLCASVEAWGAATDEEAFLAAYKKFGVSENGLDSKKPCLCVGGSVDGQAGRLVVFKVADRYHYECRIPFFSPQGTQIGSASCFALGGSTIVLSK
jgi:hypothetical protein